MKLKCLILFIFLSFPVFACDTAKLDVFTPKPVGNYEKGILWKIERCDIDKPSYLFGTIHIGGDQVSEFLEKQLFPILDKVDIAAFEIKFNIFNLIKVSTIGLLPEGQYLNNIIDEELFNQVENLLIEKYNYPPNLINKMKVWNVLAMISIPPEYLGKVPMDLLIFEKAASAGKEIKGLETVAEQEAVFESLGIEKQVYMLELAMDLVEENIRGFYRIKDAYLKQDLEGISLYIAKDWEKIPDEELVEKFRDSLLLNRNKNMAERGMPMIKQGGALISVGAAHLVGEGGLLHLLEQYNYKVTPVILE